MEVMLSQKQLSYITMAEVWAQNSKATRKKVGCIIVKDKMIISDGYNGTPSGFDNKCEIELYNGQIKTKPEVLHAEANAITKLAKSTNSSEGAELYVTCSPCFDCSKLIIQAGISSVYFKELYHDDSGLRLLLKAGILVYQLYKREDITWMREIKCIDNKLNVVWN